VAMAVASRMLPMQAVFGEVEAARCCVRQKQLVQAVFGALLERAAAGCADEECTEQEQQ